MNTEIYWGRNTVLFLLPVQIEVLCVILQLGAISELYISFTYFTLTLIQAIQWLQFYVSVHFISQLVCLLIQLGWAHTKRVFYWKQMFGVNLFELFCVLALLECGTISVKSQSCFDHQTGDEEMKMAFCQWQFLKMLNTKHERNHWVYYINKKRYMISFL